MNEQDAEKSLAFQRAVVVGMVGVRLDARVPGVDVPEPFRANPSLMLNFSPKFKPADLDIADAGLEQTLQFGADHYHCKVPWPAIWSLIAATGEEMTFPASMPEESARALAVQSLALGPLVREALAARKAMDAGAQPPPAFWLGWCRRAEFALTGREAPLVEKPRLSVVK